MDRPGAPVVADRRLRKSSGLRLAPSVNTKTLPLIVPTAVALAAMAALSYTGAALLSSVVALAIIYLCGYVTGGLLVPPRLDRDSVALGIVRLVAGLLLTSIAFLFSL